MRYVNTLDILCTLIQITLEVGRAVLVGVDLKTPSLAGCRALRTDATDRLAVESAEASGHNLEEVLEHVMRLDGLYIWMSASFHLRVAYITYVSDRLVKRVGLHSHLLTHLRAGSVFERVVLVVALKRELVDGVREIMAAAFFAEVRYKLIEIAPACLEGASGGEMDVADDLVHAHTTRDVAALRRLLADLLGPALAFALFVEVQLTESDAQLK